MELSLEQKLAVAKYLIDKNGFVDFHARHLIEDVSVLWSGKDHDSVSDLCDIQDAVNEFASSLPDLLLRAIEKESIEIGYCEDDVCGRNGCKGILKLRPVENCSCHISAPCSACTTPGEYCPECDYDAREEDWR
jgi:hypothetical protein